MEAVFGLQVMLLGVSYGVETHCDGRQAGAQCYGALGGTVNIQLMNSTSEIFRVQLLKSNLSLLTVINNSSIPYIKIQENSVFIPSNGTFITNNLSKNDSGNYSLQTFKSDGTITGERSLKLFLQAPVSSVLLLSECLSQGEMRVSCSSEGGDSPQYSWTLDGRTLTDAELLSGNKEGNNITLRQNVSGHLVCSVSNHISKVSKEQRISTCSILPIIGGVLAALAFFLVVSAAVICAQMKKQHNKCPKKEEEDEQEVSYTDIMIMKRQGEQVEQSAQMEVEYGQVRFPQGLRLTEPTGDDCLYVNVHKIKQLK